MIRPFFRRAVCVEWRRQIARETGISRVTIRKMLAHPHPPTGELLQRRDLLCEPDRMVEGRSTIEVPSPIRFVKPATQASTTSGS